ncbi:MAG: hypothetical protein V4760_17890 [Bdellovibrionota bacterium]
MQDFNEQDASFNLQPEPSVTAYRMRCPGCRKLYSVESHLILGVENPRFECVACQTAFLAHELPSGTMLETVAITETPLGPAPTAPTTRKAFEPVPMAATRPCPKCGSRNDARASECTSCGILISRFRPGEEAKVVVEIEMAGKLELVTLWDEVAADYRNMTRHEAFIRACYDASCLAFASQKYARVLAGAPEEEIARAMRKRIIGLASAKFETGSTDEMKTRWSIPLPSFNSFIIMLGVILVGVGSGLPQSRDIAGVGFAMLALAAGLRIFARRPVL